MDVDPDPVPVSIVDDDALRALAALLRRACALEEAAGRQPGAGYEAAGAYAAQIANALAALRAGSVDALLVQASALRWLYAGEGDVPDVDVGPGNSTEQKLIRALILGLYDLADPAVLGGSKHAHA